MRITKIISIASLAALVSVSSTANALCWFPGNFIAGVEVAQVSQTGDLSSTFSAPVVGEHVQKISDSGTMYGGVAGYQLKYRCYVLGLEGFVDTGYYENAKNFPVTILNPVGSPSANVLYQRGTVYGVSTRIGYAVNPCFTPYVRVGAQGSKDRFFVTYTGLAAGAFDHFEDRTTHWDWLLGVGLEMPLFSKRTSLRFEYDYSPAHAVGHTDSAGVVTAQHSYGPRVHTGKIQWVWNFI